MNIKLEPLLNKHQDFLWEMLYHAIYIPDGQEPFPKEIIQQPDFAKYAENWENENDLGLLAINKKTDEKVGAVWSRLFTRNNKGYGYIDNNTPELSISLLPAYRGKGIGTILLEKSSVFLIPSLSRN
jgi:GNAT superfamily N-acetyltransferase